ncbi:uncharacterized protein LOC134835389 [Culicoides brevitarsis]|uniref:uncharacterized protein LOC134835389 n=1 Tax=Culicoides brevitarsis TaxID=469753 RepID=UPI00307B3260
MDLSLFNFVPVTDRGFCCLDLRRSCFVIAVIHALFLADSFIEEIQILAMYDDFDDGDQPVSFWHKVIVMAFYLDFFMNVVLVVSLLFLVLGAFYRNATDIAIYFCTLLFVNVIYGVMAILFTIYHQTSGLVFLLFFVVCCYFLWIALSMHRKLIEEPSTVKELQPQQLIPPNVVTAPVAPRPLTSIYEETVVQKNANMKHDEIENPTLVLIND